MSAATAVAPAPKPPAEEKVDLLDARWQPVLGLPCRLTVDILLPGLKVADFLHLSPGSVVSTHWGIARDVPLHINGILIGWGELEGAGSRLAVRITELA